MWISSFPNMIYCRDSPFPIVYSWLLHHKLIDHICVGFFSDFSFPFHWSMCLFLCQYHIVLIVRLWNIVLNQEAWCLQLCSSFSGLLWLFVVFRIICPVSVKNAIVFLYSSSESMPENQVMFFPFLVHIYIYNDNVCCAVLSHFSHVWLFVTPWTIAHQAPLSRGCSRQEYWNGLTCPTPRDFPYPRIKPASLISLALVGGFFTTCATCEAQNNDNT